MPHDAPPPQEEASQSGWPHAISYEAYVQHLQSIELMDILMVTCAADFRAPTTPSGISLEHKHEVHLATQEDAQVTYRITHTLLGRQKRATPLKFEAEYEVILSVKDPPLSTDFLELYGEINLHVQTYPYFREWVSSTSSRMPITPIVLPLLKPAPPED